VLYYVLLNKFIPFVIKIQEIWIQTISHFAIRIYMVFHKKHPFLFFHNSLKWWSIYTKFLPVVAVEILMQNKFKQNMAVN